MTTTDLIGNGIWTLLRHPDQIQKLRDDPSLIKNAVEEILRFESPVVQTARMPLNDLKIGECPVKRGESVFMFLAAANRDPATMSTRPPCAGCFQRAPSVFDGAAVDRADRVNGPSFMCSAGSRP